MSQFTKEEIAKLPKWAREKVESLQRERDVAVSNLNKWIDESTPSPISVQELVCLGEGSGSPSFKTRYIHATDIQFDWEGVHLDVRLRKSGNMHNSCIQLAWHGAHTSEHVALVPSSFQSIDLISKKFMR